MKFYVWIHRASRKGKSNADLCRDIREFVSAAGLPEDHVPSLKELSQHGRFGKFFLLGLLILFFVGKVAILLR